MKKLSDYKFDTDYRPEVRSRLYNYILTALQAHSLTLEDLEAVMDMLRESYKREAVIPGHDGMIQPLDYAD